MVASTHHPTASVLVPKHLVGRGVLEFTSDAIFRFILAATAIIFHTIGHDYFFEIGLEFVGQIDKFGCRCCCGHSRSNCCGDG